MNFNLFIIQNNITLWIPTKFNWTQQASISINIAVSNGGAGNTNVAYFANTRPCDEGSSALFFMRREDSLHQSIHIILLLHDFHFELHKTSNL